MNQRRYYLAGISAFFIWGFFSLALKPLQDYPSVDILFFRILSSVLILLILVGIVRRKQTKASLQFVRSLDRETRKKLIVQIIIGGIFLTLNWFTFIFVMNHVSVKAASFAYLICPILTTGLAALILKEKLSAIQLIAVVISILSCAVLSVGSLKDLFFSTIVALSYAFYLISQPKHKEVDRLSVLTIQVICAGILLLTFYPAIHGPIPRQPSFYGYILTIAVIFTIVPLLLNLYALEGLKSSTTGILLYINPIVGFLLAVVYYHETIGSVQILGYSLMVVSVIVFNLPAIVSYRLKPSLQSNNDQQKN